MKYLIELPDVIKDADGNEYEATGEFRRPIPGEWCWSLYGENAHEATASSNVTLILRRKWTWPSWLKGWGIAMDKDGGSLYVYENPPTRDDDDGDGMWCCNGGSCVSLTSCSSLFDFTPPKITDWTQPILNPNYKE